jgi:hypothetical protein
MYSTEKKTLHRSIQYLLSATMIYNGQYGNIHMEGILHGETGVYLEDTKIHSVLYCRQKLIRFRDTTKEY